MNASDIKTELDSITRRKLVDLLASTHLLFSSFDEDEDRQAMRLLSSPCGFAGCTCHERLPALWRALMHFRNLPTASNEDLSL